MLAVPFTLSASMLLYSAVRYGVPPEWQFVCPREAEAHAAPLVVLASTCVIPFAKTGRATEAE